jgi:hypothetical protein
MSRSESTTRRVLLANAPIAAAGLAIGAAAESFTSGIPAAMGPSAPDPIFLVIEQHTAAVKARNAVLGAEADEGAYPTYKAWKRASDMAMDNEDAAVDGLFDTEPTTILGVAALLETLGRELDEGEDSDGSSIMDWEYGSGGIRQRADDFLVELAETLRSLIGART